jgi:hypothetical protein
MSHEDTACTGGDFILGSNVRSSLQSTVTPVDQNLALATFNLFELAGNYHPRTPGHSFHPEPLHHSQRG